MTKLTITPDDLTYKCCYTLLEPASHHDPALGTGANMNLYRRQKVRLAHEVRGAMPTEDTLDKISEAFPVPVECYDIFQDEPFERFLGIALAKVFIDGYVQSGGGDDWGQGLFTGVEAYNRLVNRMEMAAPRAQTLKEFWAILIRDMKVSPLSDTESLFKVLSVPSGCHHQTLYEIDKYASMIVEMARFWREQERLANEKYAKQAKKPQSSGEVVNLSFTLSEDTGSLESSVAVPCHSGNDLRHDIRVCGMLHLFSKVGLTLESEIPTAVKALFENGGNIGKGMTAPSDDYALSQIIRATYPLLGLLGGCTDSFMLGDSNLQSVSAFWFGKEYNTALESLFGVRAEHSVIDMLDNWTLHRHVGRYEGSPMPYAFETVSAGAKLYVNFQFSPYTPELELGAFHNALETYKAVDASIGGQAAKGFGKVKIDALETQTERFISAGEAYNEYLEENKDALAFGLKTGFLGTEKKVCAV